MSVKQLRALCRDRRLECKGLRRPGIIELLSVNDDVLQASHDDAYYGGERAGEIQFARTILDTIGVEYTVEADDE